MFSEVKLAGMRDVLIHDYMGAAGVLSLQFQVDATPQATPHPWQHRLSRRKRSRKYSCSAPATSNV